MWIMARRIDYPHLGCIKTSAGRREHIGAYVQLCSSLCGVMLVSTGKRGFLSDGHAVCRRLSRLSRPNDCSVDDGFACARVTGSMTPGLKFDAAGGLINKSCGWLRLDHYGVCGLLSIQSPVERGLMTTRAISARSLCPCGGSTWETRLTHQRPFAAAQIHIGRFRYAVGGAYRYPGS